MILGIIKNNLLCIFLLLISFKSFAELSCFNASTNQFTSTTMIPELRIYPDTKSGTILWISDLIHIPIRCVSNNGFINNNYIYDNINLFFNSYNQQIVPGLLFGIIYNDLYIENFNQNFNLANLSAQNGNVFDFNLKFKLYIKTTQNGILANPYITNRNFTAFKIGGLNEYMNNCDNKLFKYNFNMQYGVKLFFDSASVNIYPTSQQINFGSISEMDLNQGKIFSQEFSISSIRPYLLNNPNGILLDIKFETMNQLYDEYSIDLGNGTSLSIEDGENSKIKFNAHQRFGHITYNNSYFQRHYKAKIKKVGEVKTGPFHATTLVKIYYF